MSYSVDSPQLLGISERMRLSLDELDDVATALQRAVDAVALSLARAAPSRSGFLGVSEGRVDLAHRIVARGRAALSALQTALLAYLVADEEMSRETDAAAFRGLNVPNPFDPVVFGRRRL